jgi:hypothetical protein
MSLDRTKLLASFAFIGFLVGSGSYYFINWFVINSGITLPPIADIVFSPLFVSGFTGSLLSILIIVVFSHLSNKN